MNILGFNDIKILSNIEISKEIFRIEKKLFNLKLKKNYTSTF
jgi:ribosomal protein L29